MLSRLYLSLSPTPSSQPGVFYLLKCFMLVCEGVSEGRGGGGLIISWLLTRGHHQVAGPPQPIVTSGLLYPGQPVQNALCQSSSYSRWVFQTNPMTETANWEIFFSGALSVSSIFLGDSLVECCTARNHPHLLKKLPQILTFSRDQALSDKICNKQLKLLAKTDRDYLGCDLVDLHIDAFMAPTASLCLHPPAEMTNDVEDGDSCSKLILVKQTEEGLDLLMGSQPSQATAQVSYGSSQGSVAFTLKSGKVFGSIGERRPPHGGQFYSLEPCIGIKNCHLLLQIVKKPQ